jgi:hypothetical protein
VATAAIRLAIAGEEPRFLIRDNDNKFGGRHDGPEGKPDQPLYEGLRSRLAVVAVVEDAAVGAARCPWRCPWRPRRLGLSPSRQAASRRT